MLIFTYPQIVMVVIVLLLALAILFYDAYDNAPIRFRPFVVFVLITVVVAILVTKMITSMYG